MKKTFTFLLASLLLYGSSFSQNRALHFDGADDHVQIPIRTGVLTGSAITFEAWVKPLSLTGSYMPIVNQGTTGNYFLVYFQNRAMDPWDPADIRLGVFAYNGSSNGQLSYSISDAWTNQWHHIAATFNGNTLALYVDGTLVSSTPFFGTIPSSNESTWLGQGGSGDVFSGTLDEVRIWNVVRTQSEIQAAMNAEIPVATTGLTAYYKFNQGAADGNNTAITTVVDAVAANNGTLINFAKSGSTSNFTTGYGSLAVLSVKEGSFTAEKKVTTVQLAWKGMASENGAIYEVQHSRTGVDFATIGVVNGAASVTETSFSFNHGSPNAFKNYYRIKSTEPNGRISYTKVLSVSMDKIIAGLQVAPNPASGSLQLQITAPKGVVVVELKDLSGRTLQNISLASQGTTLYHSIDVSKLAKGVYTLSVDGESIMFIKQ